MMQVTNPFTLNLFEPQLATPLRAFHQHQETLALVSVTFRHPRANRQALFGSVSVAYEFKRGSRSTIGFSVSAEGLSVRAPTWVSLRQIDQAVLDKSAWILKKLQETSAKRQQLESARIDWQDGCDLPFLGAQVRVVLNPHHVVVGIGAERLKSIPCEAAQPVLCLDMPQRVLHVGLPRSATAQQIGDAVQAWLMQQATQVFTERLHHFAPILGVQWHKLGLSSASTRWGSARADGSIRLNWRLIHFKLSVIDYVVAHELSHLRVMDHSPKFWDIVRTVIPNDAELRSQLKGQLVPRW